MSEILVLAAHDGESVKKVTLELLTLARRFGEHLCGRGHVVRHAVALGGVDLGGAVLGQPLPARVRARTQPDRGGLAEPAGQRKQFVRDLLDRLTDVRGEDEDL